MTQILRMSNLYAPTLKEDPSDADIDSARLLLRAGMLRIRYLRPMPDAALARALVDAAAVGVLEQDISFGGTGTVYANVLASLARAGIARPSANFIGGLGGDDISEAQVEGMFRALAQAADGTLDLPHVSFLGIDSPADAVSEGGR